MVIKDNRRSIIKDIHNNRQTKSTYNNRWEYVIDKTVVIFSLACTLLFILSVGVVFFPPIVIFFLFGLTFVTGGGFTSIIFAPMFVAYLTHLYHTVDVVFISENQPIIFDILATYFFPLGIMNGVALWFGAAI